MIVLYATLRFSLTFVSQTVLMIAQIIYKLLCLCMSVNKIKCFINLLQSSHISCV